MIDMGEREKKYILQGDEDLLNALIVRANRKILLLEKKYDEMLEKEEAEIRRLSKEIETRDKDPELETTLRILELICFRAAYGHDPDLCAATNEVIKAVKTELLNLQTIGPDYKIGSTIGHKVKLGEKF
jgi:hypothetical protein